MADALLTSARVMGVMGVTKDLGIIAAEKLADMILIDGDPCEEHSRHPQHHHRDQGRKGLRSGRDRKVLGIAPRPSRR